MAKRNSALVVRATPVVALCIALGAGCAGGGRGLGSGPHPTQDATGAWSDSEGTFTLRDVSGVCTLTGKDTEVEVAKGKKVTWTVRNFCNAPQTLTIGNFRQGPSTRTDCSQGTEGVAWPFNANDQNLNKRQANLGPGAGIKPQEATFKLQDAKNTTNGPVAYQFDVCVGAGNGIKVDPRLVIDP